MVEPSESEIQTPLPQFLANCSAKSSNVSGMWPSVQMRMCVEEVREAEYHAVTSDSSRSDSREIGEYSSSNWSESHMSEFCQTRE